MWLHKFATWTASRDHDRDRDRDRDSDRDRNHDRDRDRDRDHDRDRDRDRDSATIFISARRNCEAGRVDKAVWVSRTSAVMVAERHPTSVSPSNGWTCTSSPRSW
jgi:ABC-type Zn2+ transport system substrate-binding protein/surface adhesin